MAKKTQKSLPASGVLGEPRGRLLGELCGQSLTASELAVKVGTSSNAVRVHLDGLREAGLVEFRVERRGVGKPTHVYALTAAAEYLLSAAYAPALGSILAQLRSQLNGGLRPVLREAGKRLADSHIRHDGKAAGVTAAVRLLRALGTQASVEQQSDRQTIRAACCPLGAVTREHADLCAFLEGALSSVVGAAVTESCDRSEHPRCAFHIEHSPKGS